MKSFCIGSSKHEFIIVKVINYERAVTGDYHDDNWLNVEVELKIGGFKGAFSASFLTEDFVNFYHEVQHLYEVLHGTAKFHTLEGQLSFALKGNGLGGIEVKGVAQDQIGVGNELVFGFLLDQTHLVALLKELIEINASFPIRTV